MTAVCFYFQVHQPLRVRRYRIFDIGKEHDYFEHRGADNLNNRKVLEKVSNKCYLPANKVIEELLKKHPNFKVSFSFSGVLLEQLERDQPDVLASFKRLVDTGKVEVLGETYYHSLAALYSDKEFEAQVRLHSVLVKRLFSFKPKVFRNTELIYHNHIADLVAKLGFKGILAEGADRILGFRSPDFVYQAHRTPIKMLLKNYRLSDDIAFRFSSREWSEFPLTASKFASWISARNGAADVINLFMDYETFGEHQWEDTGIFEFLKALPEEVERHPDNRFVTPSEAFDNFPARETLDVPYYVSWADIERDLSAWRSNEMQYEALKRIYDLEKPILASGEGKLLDDWRKLQTSDHFYYMCTKWFADGDVHKYFNPYESPYDAFIAYINAVNDLQLRVQEGKRAKRWPATISNEYH
ncbi:MAG: glycoside hydrolase family 57 protein [bacterium]|nr:glycoside hydrolase family 57 protein [bacterium]